jgi:Delta7-sterol 5-desaturase
MTLVDRCPCNQIFGGIVKRIGRMYISESSGADMLDWLWNLNLYTASLVFLISNVLIFLGALTVGKALDRIFGVNNRERPRKISTEEIGLAVSTVLINSAITSGGWYLWHASLISINTSGTFWQIARDALILLITMDAALYLLHRIAHLAIFYQLAHYKHHQYREVRVLTLFVMSPLEALGFGSLWVLTLTSFPFCIESILIFLNLNLFFGISAHCGYKLYSPGILRGLRAIGISDPDFHRMHHANEDTNLGFYTVIWDYIFRTSAASQKQSSPIVDK